MISEEEGREKRQREIRALVASGQCKHSIYFVPCEMASKGGNESL
jgi:hypothetical protein